jgi:hypothetical protein
MLHICVVLPLLLDRSFLQPSAQLFLLLFVLQKKIFGPLALSLPSPSGLRLSKLFMTLEVTSHVLTNLYFVLYLFNFGRRSAHLRLANSIIRRQATNLSSKAFILSKFRYLDERLNTTFVLLKT